MYQKLSADVLCARYSTARLIGLGFGRDNIPCVSTFLVTFGAMAKKKAAPLKPVPEPGAAAVPLPKEVCTTLLHISVVTSTQNYGNVNHIATSRSEAVATSIDSALLGTLGLSAEQQELVRSKMLLG